MEIPSFAFVNVEKVTFNRTPQSACYNHIFIVIERQQKLIGIKHSSKSIESKIEIINSENEAIFNMDACFPITYRKGSPKFIKIKVGLFDEDKEILCEFEFDVTRKKDHKDCSYMEKEIYIGNTFTKCTIRYKHALLPKNIFPNGDASLLVSKFSTFSTREEILEFLKKKYEHIEKRKNSVDIDSYDYEGSSSSNEDLEKIESFGYHQNQESPSLKSFKTPSMYNIQLTPASPAHEEPKKTQESLLPVTRTRTRSKIAELKNRNKTPMFSLNMRAQSMIIPKDDILQSLKEQKEEEKEKEKEQKPEPTEEEDEEEKQKTALKAELKAQKKILRNILLYQFKAMYSMIVFKRIVTVDSLTEDISAELMKPVTDFNILSIHHLSENDFYDAVSPLFEAMNLFFTKKSDLISQFSLISSLINFGLNISIEAEYYTNAHKKAISAIEHDISQLIIQLAGFLYAPLVSTIATNPMDFLSQDSFSCVSNDVQKFFHIAQKYKISLYVTEQIVRRTCETTDEIVASFLTQFSNVNSEAEKSANYEIFMKRIKKLEQLFMCFIPDVKLSFPCLLSALKSNGTKTNKAEKTEISFSFQSLRMFSLDEDQNEIV